MWISNDLEHYALGILDLFEQDVEKGSAPAGETDDGIRNGILYTETADQLSRQYAEILVDEYQDSNYVQETFDPELVRGAGLAAKRIYGGRCEAEYLQIPSGAARSYLWKNTHPIRMRTVPARRLNFTRISEAGNRCWTA